MTLEEMNKFLDDTLQGFVDRFNNKNLTQTDIRIARNTEVGKKIDAIKKALQTGHRLVKISREVEDALEIGYGSDDAFMEAINDYEACFDSDDSLC